MDFHYSFVYLIVNVICVLSALVILARLNSSFGSETENRLFRCMLYCYMAFLFCEILWILSAGGMVPLGGFAQGLIKIIGTVFIPIKVYFWFQFAEVRFGNPAAHTTRFRLLTAIPLIIMLLIYLSSVVTGAVARVDESGAVVPGPALAISGIIDNLYGIAVVIHAIILWKKDKEDFRKKEYAAHILFILICTVGGITDTVVSDTPVMPLAIMLSLNVLFIMLQEGKIFNDALTGLNNRRLADRFISSAIEECGRENPLGIFMMDIDDFKSINDVYGHLEGDRALIGVSDALRNAISRHHGFLARWGGDEFVVALPGLKEDTVARFKEDLTQELAAVNRQLSSSFTLSLSMGQEICTDKGRSLADVIAKADENLYADKSGKKRRIA